MGNVRRIVLVGFSGTGKSTVARLVAARLGWVCLDMDDNLTAEFETTIPEVFAKHGEIYFRSAERRELERACARDGVVVATGGGAVVDPGAWDPGLLGGDGTLVVALDAQPEIMLARLQGQQEAEGGAVERPMIAGSDPLSRIESLKQSRQQAYDRAAVTLIVDGIDPETVAEEIVSLLPAETGIAQPTVELAAASGLSKIYIESGVRNQLGMLARQRWGQAQRVWVVTDEHVAALHGETAISGIGAAGFVANLKAVPAGEGSKSLATSGELYDWLLDGGIERGDLIVALGGGVVGDLVGFVAATVLRGVGLLQVPTSLLAMVDSSVGGKTGINHRVGKNLIGVILQPPVVAIDPSYLSTLPHRKLAEGWAEVIKHAVIQRSTPGGERGDLLRFLERNSRQLMALEEPAITYTIRRNVALKAAVVAADERETGVRAYLNFGHTLGHAIEASGYRYLHGEAIAVGMRAAMRIGHGLGSVSGEDCERVDRLLEAYGLPLEAEVDPESVMQKMTSDKKRVAGKQRWVMPLSGGGVELREDISEAQIRSSLEAVRV